MQEVLDFSAYIAERAKGFVGREWVFAEIDRWLADPDAPRYFIIIGEPGIGKTAIAARLTQISSGQVLSSDSFSRVTQGFLSAYHFCSARNGGWIVPDRFSRALSQQLAVRYPRFAEAIVENLRIDVKQTVNTNLGQVIGAQINHYYAESPELVFDSLVRHPLKELRRAGGTSTPVVILVDGLDESLSHRGRTGVVHLLTTLGDVPDNVRFVVTTRPVERVLDRLRPFDPFILYAHSDENQRDMRRYVNVRFAQSDRLRQAAGDLAASAQIIQELGQRSAGNFLVMSKVLDAVERGDVTLDDPGALPTELEDLYAWFLDRLTQGDRRMWRRHYRPVLGMLCAVYEPVSISQLCRWLDLPRQDVRDALYDLRELLDPAIDDRYRLYHESVSDFLTGEAAGGYGIDVPTYHRQIAAYYRGQSPTWDDVDWSGADEYGLLFLAAHLDECDQGDLYALVESLAWTAAKYVDTPWAASLVQDLHRAAAVASRGDITDLARSMGYQLRRALIERQMGGVSYRAILFLARLGQVERALDFARRRRQQFDLMREIAQIVLPTCPENARDIWTEMAHLLDDRGSLQQCQARLAAAQEILLRAPSFSPVARDLVEEAKGVENGVSESGWPEYRTDWALPTLALSDGIDAALEASRDLPPLERARALRHISLALPEDHPSKPDFVEQALTLLESMEQTPQVVTGRMKATVTLLPFVTDDRRKELLGCLEAAGDYLQSVREPAQYSFIQAWTIERVAKVDLEWARRMFLESDWRGALAGGDEILREIAKTDYVEALRFYEEHLTGTLGHAKLLVDIIRTVALEDIDRAKDLVRERAGQLRDEMREAHLAIAEAYLAQGDDQQAQRVFDNDVLVIDDEGLTHARGDLQLAIVERAGVFLPVEVVHDRLMQFPACPRCRQGNEQEAMSVLARIAARQGKVEFLQQHRFGRDAQLAAAHDLADYVSPEAAREYLDNERISKWTRDSGKVYAHIAVVEMRQDPAKLDVLMEHYDDDGRSHHFCPYMTALPDVLCALVREGGLEAADAKAVIERLFSLIVDWQCPDGDRSPPHRLLGGQCACYDRRDQVLAHLIGIMAQLDPDRAKEMVDSLPAQPIKVYALKQILHHTRADESLIEEIIKASQRCMEDPWLRAGSHYDLALLSPSEREDWIGRLIGLAEPLLDQEPIREVSEFGIRPRVGPSRTELRIRKAQTLIKLVGSVDQLDQAGDAWRIMERLAQLRDKLRVLGVLTEQAMEWPEKDRLALLRRICEIAASRDWMDVQAFLAFSIPLVYSLGGEDAFWPLYDYADWAYRLPQVTQPQEGRV